MIDESLRWGMQKVYEGGGGGFEGQPGYGLLLLVVIHLLLWGHEVYILHPGPAQPQHAGSF
jgi:hypothetical protein